MAALVLIVGLIWVAVVIGWVVSRHEINVLQMQVEQLNDVVARIDRHIALEVAKGRLVAPPESK